MSLRDIYSDQTWGSRRFLKISQALALEFCRLVSHFQRTLSTLDIGFLVSYTSSNMSREQKRINSVRILFRSQLLLKLKLITRNVRSCRDGTGVAAKIAESFFACIPGKHAHACGCASLAQIELENRAFHLCPSCGSSLQGDKLVLC